LFHSCERLDAGRYFDEISQDTGKFCFGVDDTLKALEMGAVETLIVWENLDTMRYVLKNHSTDGEWGWRRIVIVLCNNAFPPAHNTVDLSMHTWAAEVGGKGDLDLPEILKISAK